MFARCISNFTRVFVAISIAFVFALGALGPSAPGLRAASPPNIITYQGRLLDANGTPISSSSASMIFLLYDAVSAGNCLYASGGTCGSPSARTVTLTNGLFSENVGDITLASPYNAIADTVFDDNASVFLEVRVGSETLSPRKRMTAAPYALNSELLDGVDSTEIDLDFAYDNDTARLLAVDQSGGLEFESSVSGNIVFDLTSTGDIVFQDASTPFATFSDTSTITFTLADNLTDALDIQQGTNNYLNLNTTNSSENLAFGNATTNPSYSFLGTGAVTIAGSADGTDALVLTLGDLLISDGDFDMSGGDFNVILNSGDGALISATAADTNPDALSVIGVSADNDGAQVSFQLRDDSGVDTVGALRVAVVSVGSPGAADADVLAGLYLPTPTSTNATVLERAIQVDDTWDAQLFLNDTTSIVQLVDASTLTIEDASGNDIFVLADVSTASSHTLTGDTDTGLILSGMSTDLSTGTNEDLTIAPNGTGDLVIDTDSNTQVTLNGGGDGVDSLVLTDGDILVSDGDFDMTGGDFNVVLDAGDGALISGTSSATNPDAFSIIGLSADNDGTQVSFQLLDDANVDTVAALRIAAVSVGSPGTADADVFAGLYLPAPTSTNATVLERAIQIDNTWDTQIMLNDITSVIQLVDAATLSITDGTNTLFSFVDDGTDGLFNCNECIDGDDLEDLIEIDSSTSIVLNSAETFTFTNGGSANVITNLTSTGDFVVQDSGNAVFTVNDDRSVDYTTDQTVTNAFDITADSLTTGNAINMSIDGLTIGTGVSVDTTSSAFTSGILFQGKQTSTYTGTTTVDGNLMSLARTVTANAPGGTVTVSGAAATISNSGTQTLGTLTVTAPVLSVTENYTASTGPTLVVTNQGTGIGLRIRQTSVDAPASGSTSNQAFVIDSTEVQSNDDVFIIRSSAAGSADTEFLIENDGDVFNDGAIYSAPADFAEMFYSPEALAPGETVALDPADPTKVLRTTGAYADRVIGVVSTAPAFVGNYKEWPSHYPIALLGQVPTKVSGENGAIAIGDPLVSASVPGHVMKATEPGTIIGRALESFSGSGTGTITAFIQPGWYAGNVIGTDGSSIVVSDTFLLGPLGFASADLPVRNSQAVVLQGAGWNGSASQPLAMKLVTVVSDLLNYKLSFQNQAGAEVVSISNQGALTLASDLVVGGRLYPSDRGVPQANRYIFYDGSAGPGGDFMRTNASGWATGSYDFAEMFPSADALEPGDLVVFAQTTESVTRSVQAKDARVAGIVSTRPGFLAGDNTPGSFPIALAGRVPANVTVEGGTIAVGDPLTTSSTAGAAMKASAGAPIVGFALEPFDGNDADGKIVVFVNLGHASGAATAVPGVDNSASLASSAPASLTSLSLSGSLSLQGNDVLDIRRLASVSGSWSLEADGTLRTKGLLTSVITTNNGDEVETIATTSREPFVTLYGTTELVGIETEVKFEQIDPAFAQIINADTPYRVIATPNASVLVYVTDKTKDGFRLRTDSSPGGVFVDWMVVAYRKGYPSSVILSEAKDLQENGVSSVEVPSDVQTIEVVAPTNDGTDTTNMTNRIDGSNGSSETPQPVTEPTVEPVPEPSVESATEPIVEPAPEPVPAPESAPEPPAAEPAPSTS